MNIFEGIYHVSRSTIILCVILSRFQADAYRLNDYNRNVCTGISGWLKPPAFDVHARESVRIVIEIRFRAAKRKASTIIDRSITIDRQRALCRIILADIAVQEHWIIRAKRARSPYVELWVYRLWHSPIISREIFCNHYVRGLLYYCHNHIALLP